MQDEVFENVSGEDVTDLVPDLTSGIDEGEDVAGDIIQDEEGATPPSSSDDAFDEPVKSEPAQEETLEPTREVIYVDVDGRADPSDTSAVVAEVRDRMDVLLQYEQASMEFNSMSATFLLVLVIGLICTAAYRFLRIFF